MSNPTFFIKLKDWEHSRRAYPISIVDGKILLSVTVPGYMREEFQAEVELTDIRQMNTEAAGWLERNGIRLPDTAPVRASGYGADIKQEIWDKRNQ